MLCFNFSPVNVTGRFESTPPHPDRWDMMLYAGGPVWALEWCPTPVGAPAAQYVALSCHQHMDDLHYVNKTYAGAGLVQLWDVGSLEYSSRYVTAATLFPGRVRIFFCIPVSRLCPHRPESKPGVVYGLAQDKGFIWHLKWCPAGGWELPSCARKVRCFSYEASELILK